MKKQYAWDQVDRLAEEWYATPAGEEHAAIKQKLLEEFLGLSCDLLSESMMDGLGDFWEQDFQRFDPALSPFSKFLLSRLKLRARDGVREDLGLRRVKRDGETVTEGAFSLDDTGGKDADDDMTREVRDPMAEEALEELFLDERAYECLSLMLDLPNKLQGKANNPEKINYYRMFFTDGVTDYVRSSGGQVFFAHEANLFQAAKLPFLDFFLDRVCRTVPRLASSETRPYGQLVEGRPDEPVEQPLPQDVYRSYLAREEGRRAGLSAISQQRTAYRAFLKRMLQC